MKEGSLDDQTAYHNLRGLATGSKGTRYVDRNGYAHLVQPEKVGVPMLFARMTEILLRRLGGAR